MDKTKIIFGIGIVLAVLAVLIAPAAAQDYNIFHLVPEDSSCNPGEDVTVWVKVNTSYSDINAFQASIIFDPSMANVTLVEKGTNPNWGGMWEYIFGDYGAKKYVSIRASTPWDAFGPGELELGKMTLHCEAAGISLLHFGDESELGLDRTEIGHPAGNIWPITTEDGTFSCGVTPETFSKYLVEGWNLVSLPLTPLVDNSASAVLGGTIAYDAVYSYDAVTNEFEDVKTGTMDPGIGYFVHVTTAGTWTYNGVAKTSMSVPLEQGLNMVGWLNCSKSISDGLSSIDGNYYYAARWNAGTQEFETYNPVAPNGFNDFADMERGDGYFISAKAESTLSESC